MSGHSKWSTIKHQKGAKDAKRGKLFAKLIRAIEVAARTGGANPEGNATLADAIQKAKDNSVPNDTIDRAVKRGAGEVAGQQLDLVTYEGYAPGGVAVLVEALTDNRNRTAADIRHVFTRGGGSIADAGSVAYLFNRRGQLVVPGDGADEDRVMEVALEAGAEDVDPGEDGLTVTTAPGDLRAVRAAFDQAGIHYAAAEVTMVPSMSVPLQRDAAVRVLRLLDALEDLDDVQDVYANFDIPDDVMAEVS
jgi:YebC/PmpR family DNA-binding regulatory protein